ncbi:MAG: hypothetical protein R3287_06745 [Anderseniella sp.]|nr:hypothetical protein [Anderseniella sp.]
MLKKTMMTAAAAVLMFNVNTLTASAYSPMPEVSAKAPVSAPAADGSYKVAHRIGRRHSHRRSNRGRNIGLGIAAGVIGLGAAAAAADAARRDRRRYGRCERVERRCARRHGWETRRWYWCVDDRGC